jgi:hypothetical protein
MVGILLHVVMDRGDLCFAVRLTAQHLREPTVQSMDRLRRVIKYAYGTRHDELKFERAEAIRELYLFSDSDWAGNKTTRKSATCAVIRVGHCSLAVLARGQAVRAQSSCEAEFYGAATAVMEGAHLQQLLAWMSLPLRMRLATDSSAARSAMMRRGVGRMRHMEVKVLWLQDMVARGRCLVDKVPGVENPADIGTKPLSKETYQKLRVMLAIGLFRVQ